MHHLPVMHGFCPDGYLSDVHLDEDHLAGGEVGLAEGQTARSLKMMLDADLANAATARRALGAAANRAGLDGETAAKAKVVVSEAFSNAATHAYPEGEDGEIEVTAVLDPSGVTVVVRDHGIGMRPRPASGRSSERLGLLLIAALAESTRLRHLPDGGMELRAEIPAQASWS
jgi:anti-sigma regulatory factor (Ser/Thr protein kinase)